MVDAAATTAAEPQVQRRDGQVIEERGVVRSGTERRDWHVRPRAQFLLVLFVARLLDLSRALCLEDRAPAVERIRQIACDVVDEGLQRV
jgi:hypothetical protein